MKCRLSQIEHESASKDREIEEKERVISELEGKSAGMLEVPKKISPTKKRHARSSIGFDYK